MANTTLNMQTAINKETQKFKTLTNLFENIYQAEHNLFLEREDIFKTISKIKDKDNKQLNEIFGIFTSKMQEIEKYRKENIENFQNKYIPAIKFFPEKMKGIKDGSITITKDSNNQNNSSKISADTIEKKFALAEIERRKDYRYLFLNMVSSEMEYHARSLEGLARLFREINLHEPLEEIEDYIKQYNIQVDPKEYKIDVDELRRIKKEKELKREKEKNDVYENNDK